MPYAISTTANRGVRKGNQLDSELPMPDKIMVFILIGFSEYKLGNIYNT